MIEVIKSKKDVPKLISFIKKSPFIVFDFETSCLDPQTHGSKLLSIAFGNDKKSFAIPLDHKDSWFNGIWHPIFKGVFEELLNHKKIVCQNAKFEYKWSYLFLHKGFQVHFDTMYVHHMFDEVSPAGLDFLTKIYVPDMDVYEMELANSLTEKHNYESAPIDILLRYNAMDVEATSKCYLVLDKMLEGDKELKWVWYNLARYVSTTLAQMELNGFTADEAELDRLISVYNNLRTEKENNIKNYKLTAKFFKDNPDFNFNSYPQLRVYLYDVLGFPVLRKTKINHKTGSGGTPSTDLKTLEMFEATGEHNKVIINLVSRTKVNTQLKSFLNVFKEKLSTSSDGKLRTNFNMHTVETFRLSSSDPNLQNLPTSEMLEKYELEPIKTIFVSEHGSKGLIVSADHSQIELRTCAIYTGDKLFTKAFMEGRDLHGELAEVIYGKNYTKEQRGKAKRTNFSAIFDISAKTLAVNLKIDEKEAQEILNTFWHVHKDIRNWFDETWFFAKENGYIRNKLGRIRHVANEIETAFESWEIESIMRQVYNFPIQSSASDITLTGLYLINQALAEKGIRAKTIGSVHDSMIWDCDKRDVKKLAKLINELAVKKVESMYKWITIPLKIDISAGVNYHDLEDIK